MANHVSAGGLQSLTAEAAKSLIHALISCHLDHCKACHMALQTVSFSDFSQCRMLLRR